jgi:hypothetical protein
LATSFSQAVSQAVTQEFPLISVAPAFTYHYNPALGAHQRSTAVPGPLFSERALTIGAGDLDVGVGYSYVSFSELNGTDLDNIHSPALLRELHLNEVVPGEKLFFFAPVSFSRLRMRLDLDAHVIAPTLRYGLTEQWDIGVVVPIVSTFLRVKTETIRVADVDPSFARFKLGAITSSDDCATPVGKEFCPIGFRGTSDNSVLQDEDARLIASRRPSGRLAKSSGSATGIGDISLRTKYHFWNSKPGGAAFGLALQLPSGEERNLHGAGNVRLSTFLYVSRVLAERIEPHLNLGIDWNADDVERSSFLYAAGASMLVGKNLGVTLDVLGRNEFQRFPVRIPADGIVRSTFRLNNSSANACTTQRPCFVSGAEPFPFFPARIKRNDIINVSVGIRYALGTTGSVFFGGILPLNNDGLRSDFIPSGGIEYTF